MPQLSQRATSLGTENAFVVLAEVNALIRAGRDVISFCIGQPDFPTPVHIQDAAVAAVRGGKHGYTPSAGIDELRAAAAASMSALRGISISADDVVVGAGAKPFIAYAIASVTDYGSGDEVVFPVSGFPIYESQCKALGAVPVGLPLRESRRFAFDPDELAARITPKTKLLILNTPHNPTGGLLTRADLEAIAEVVREHPQVWVYADEIYSKLVYQDETSSAQFVSIASLPGMQERTIISDGASKTYAMTGWRIGTTLAPAPIAKAISELQSQMSSNVTTFAQYGALAALKEKEKTAAALKTMLVAFDRRRKFLHAELNKIPGITCLLAEGAFYLFPNITSFGLKDIEFCNRLLDEEKVAAVPGSAFGAEGYLRLSYATSDEIIQKGVTRLARFCAKLKK